MPRVSLDAFVFRYGLLAITAVAIASPPEGSSGHRLPKAPSAQRAIGLEPLEPCEFAKVTASDAAAGDRFGASVSVSGDTFVVGAVRDSDAGEDSGSAYVFVRANGVCTKQQELIASDAAAGDGFGASVSVSGDTFVVGAPRDSDAGEDSGSAYVFVRSDGVWTEQQKLTAPDAAARDWFGESVSVSGDTIVVGARMDDDGGDSSGSAYAFVRSDGAWTEQQKLTAPDAAPDDQFGVSVSVSGDTIVVGARLDTNWAGSAYVYVRSDGVWTEQQKLSASDEEQGDEFGISVSLSANVLAVGAHNNDDACVWNIFCESGSAYVFVRSGTMWSERQKLTASDAAPGDRFGRSVSVSGDTIVVGAHLDDDVGDLSGSAYVFVRSDEVWFEQRKLTAANAAAGSAIGQLGFASVKGLAFDSTTNTLFGTDTATDQLISIDTLTGHGTTVGPLGFSNVEGLTVDPYTSILYGTDTASDELIAIDKTTGISTVIGALGFTAVKGLAFDPNTNTLFGTDTSSDTLVAIDTATGTGTAVGPLGFGSTRGLAFDPTSNMLFATDTATNQLISIDTATGAGTAVDALGFFNVEGLAFDPNSNRLFGTDVASDELIIVDTAAGGQFGASVSTSGDATVIGSPSDDVNGTSSGSVYVFAPDACEADCDGNGIPDTCDFDCGPVGGPCDIPDCGSILDCNANGFPDICDTVTGLSEDCNLNATPDECDISGGFSADCNVNERPDECDVASSPGFPAGSCEKDCSEDCNENGSPDECERHPMGDAQSMWVGGSVCDPDQGTEQCWQMAANWCPEVVPADGGGAAFSVSISGVTSVVTLDINPTITELSLLNGAVVEANSLSGASPRTLAVVNDVTNSGMFRATDGFRLVLDAPRIAQSSNGILQSDDDGTLPPNEKSVLQINGGLVTGGLARILGCQSTIELIGGAEFRDVRIEAECDVGISGVVIPDFQIAVVGGTVTNSAHIHVVAETHPTFLLLGGENPVLAGSGSIVLEKQSLARLDSVGTTLINAMGHTIEGAGIVLGGLRNDGLVEANITDEKMVLSAPGLKMNDGAMQASSGGILSIEDTIDQNPTGMIGATLGGRVVISADIVGCGELRATSGTVIIDDAHASFARVCIATLSDQLSGMLQVDGGAEVSVTGALELNDGSVYSTTPEHSSFVTARVTTNSVNVACSSMVLTDGMSLTVEGDLEVSGSVASLFDVGGCDPPDYEGFQSTDASEVEVGGDLRLIDRAPVLHDSLVPMRLEGDFANRFRYGVGSTNDVSIFNWLDGGLMLNGTSETPQRFEVAGEDRGPTLGGFVNNFAIGMIEVASSTHAVFVDGFANGGIEPPGGCTEALYVENLVLRAGSHVTVVDCKVHYRTLIDEGVVLVQVGCGELVPIPCSSSDGDCDGDVDADDYRLFWICATSGSRDGGGVDCSVFDTDLDGDVDLIDWSALQSGFGGS